MKFLDLTLPTPAENLACDEALLENCENGSPHEILRCWELQKYFAVLGFANRAGVELNLENCHRHQIPVLRRISGGGTVLQGPGCLNYTLILKIDPVGETRSISATNRFVMERHAELMQKILAQPVEVRGDTDLALGDLKFSGNAQRRRKHFLIFHGTFLLNFDVGLMEECLRPPSKEPGYRRHRAHGDFLVSLGISAGAIITALREAWNAQEISSPPPDMRELAAGKYACDSWNFKR
jgi:lipoate-protein ligase A